MALIIPTSRAPQPNEQTEEDQRVFSYLDNLNTEDIPRNFGIELPDYRQRAGTIEQDVRRADYPTWGQEFVRGLYRGVDQLGATGMAAIGAASETIGAQDIADWSYDKYLDQMQSAEYNRGTVDSIKDIESLDGLTRYAIGGVASNLPMFLPGLVTGGVGGMVAKKAAAELVKDWALKHGAEEAAKMVTRRVTLGRGLGAYAGSATIETGQIAGMNRDDTGSFNPETAIPGGLIAGAFDAIPEIKILNNVFGKEITSGITKRLRSRIGTAALQTGLMEAPTEAVQTVIENMANKMASPTPSAWSEQDWWDVADAAAQGFLGGGVLGAVSGIPSHVPNGPTLAPSDNAAANQKVKSIQEKAANKIIDPTEDSFAINETDVALAAAQAFLKVIQSQIDDLNSQIEETGDPDRTLGIRKKELEAVLISDPQSTKPTRTGIDPGIPLETETKEFGTPVLTPEQAAQVTINRVADKLVIGKTNPEGATKIRAAIHETLTALAPLLAGTQAKVYTRSDYVKKHGSSRVKTDKPFVTYDKDTGDISLVLPEPRALVSSTPDLEALAQNRIPKRIDHEAIHIAVIKAFQDEYKSTNQKGSRGAYITKRIGQVAAALRISDPQIFGKKLGGVYRVTDSEGNPIKLSDEQAAMEFIRMIVERMRTGQITEDIDYLDAQSRQEGTIGQQAKDILAKLLDSIRAIREAINRYIVNPTPAIKKVVDDTNSILDKYKAILPKQSDIRPEAKTSQPGAGEMSVPVERRRVETQPKKIVQSEEWFSREQNISHDDILRSAQDVDEASVKSLADFISTKTAWPESGVKLEGVAGAPDGMLAIITPISKPNTPYQVTFFDTGSDNIPRPFGDVAVNSLEDGIREAFKRNFTGTSAYPAWESETGTSSELTGLAKERSQKFSQGTSLPGEAGESELLNVFGASDDPVEHFKKTGKAPIQDQIPVSILEAPTDQIQSDLQKYAEKAKRQAYGYKQKTGPEVRRAGMRGIRNVDTELNYLSFPRDEAFQRAADIVEENGAHATALALVKNASGTSIGIPTGQGGILAAVHKILAATFDNASRDAMERMDLDGLNYLQNLSAEIKNQASLQGRSAGRYIDAQNVTNQTFRGSDGGKQYIRLLFSSLHGYDPRHFQKITEFFQTIYNNFKKRAITSVEAKSAMYAALKGVASEWKKDAARVKRETKKTQVEQIAKDSESQFTLPEDIAAIYFLAGNDLESHVNTVMGRVVNALNARASFGMPIQKPGKTLEQQILSAIAKTNRKRLEKAGVYGKESRINPPSQLDEIKMVLSNPEMYQEMINELEIGAADSAEMKVSSREWDQYRTEFESLRKIPVTEEELDKAITDVSKQLQIKMPELIRKTFGKGMTDINDIKAQFRKELEGVTDKANIDNVAKRFNDLVNSRYDNAINKMFSVKENPRTGNLSGGALEKAIREFEQIYPSELTKDVKTLSDLAELSSRDIGDWKVSFADHIVRFLGIPNTAEFPLAQKVANTISKSLDTLIEQEIQNGKDEALEKASALLEEQLPSSAKPKSRSVIERVYRLANRGVLDDATIYNAIRDVNPGINLPEYDPDFAANIRKQGDLIAQIPFDRPRMVEQQKMNREFMKKTRVKFIDAAIGWGYFSQLSGINTWGMVNPIGNIFNLVPQVIAWSAINHHNAHRIMGNLIYAFTHQARDEAALAFKEGVTPTKAEKLVKSSAFENASIEANPWFGRIADKAKYLFRALDATDVFFNRLAFYAYLGKSGLSFNDSEARQAALQNARDQITSLGLEDRSGKLAAIWADDMMLGLVDQKILSVAETKAKMATFTQPPQGALGEFVSLANKAAESKNPWIKVSKFLALPYTSILANYFNEYLNYTPWGLLRYVSSGLPEGNILRTAAESYRLKDQSGIDVGVDKDLIWKSIGGTMFAMYLLAIKPDGEDDKNWIDFYGDGTTFTRDQKNQLKQAGWRPNTVKIFGVYWDALLNPMGLWLAWLGKIRDMERAGKMDEGAFAYVSSAFTGVISATMNQTYLKSMNDFYEALQGAERGTQLARYFSRQTIGTASNPAIVRNINQLLNPNLPNQTSADEIIVGNLPFANMFMRPALNYWGEPMQGQRIPTERVASPERDPLMILLGNKGVRLPDRGKPFNKGKPFDDDQLYEYNRLTGQYFRKEIERKLPVIERLNTEEADNLIEDLSRQSKGKAKREVLSGR